MILIIFIKKDCLKNKFNYHSRSMASKNNYFKNKNILISGGNRGIGLKLQNIFISLEQIFFAKKKEIKKVSNILKSKKIKK